MQVQLRITTFGFKYAGHFKDCMVFYHNAKPFENVFLQEFAESCFTRNQEKYKPWIQIQICDAVPYIKFPNYYHVRNTGFPPHKYAPLFIPILYL